METKNNKNLSTQDKKSKVYKIMIGFYDSINCDAQVRPCSLCVFQKRCHYLYSTYTNLVKQIENEKL
jgi:hypothetical protein